MAHAIRAIRHPSAIVDELGPETAQALLTVLLDTLDDRANDDARWHLLLLAVHLRAEQAIRS